MHYAIKAGILHAAIELRDLVDLRFTSEHIRSIAINGTPDFMMAIVALLGYEGIVKRVEPDLDFQAMARDMLSSMRVRPSS